MKEPQSYVLYARGKLPLDEYTRIHVVIFFERHEARTWLDEMIGTDSYTRVDNTITLASGITLTSEQLDQFIDTQLEGWELPVKYVRWIMRFKYGTWDGLGAKPKSTAVDKETKNQPEVVRERRAVRPSGFVSITELCAASGVPAMTARAALRASGRIKPEWGWCFAPEEVPAIKSLCGI